MKPAVRSWTRDEMMKRVAFFKDLKGSKTGLPDSDRPECERELINVIGFQPSDSERDVIFAGPRPACSAIGHSDL